MATTDPLAYTNNNLDMTRVISKSVKSHQGSIIAALFENAARKLPKYKTQIDAAAPYAVKAGELVDMAYPHVRIIFTKVHQFYVQSHSYVPEEAIPLIFGFIICFFGGSYVMLIAAVECVRLVIWERMYEAFHVLVQNYYAAYHASIKDNEADEDNDGIPDVKQIHADELLTRKVYLFFRTVDPKQVSEATTSLWACILSVVATLRIQFAQAITLGCAVGEILHTHLKPKIDPFLETAIPADLKAWAPIVADYLFRLIGIIVAWWLSRLIAAFHAAVRGADMFVMQSVTIMKKKGYLSPDIHADSPQVSLFVGLIAFMGFYWQLSNGFGVPFPLNILLFPFTVAEWLLSTFVFLLSGFSGGVPQ